MNDEVADWPERTHYHFRISLRVRHSNADPKDITNALGVQPKYSRKAGERRRTPRGILLDGVNLHSYWSAEFLAGRWPSGLGSGIHEVLTRLAPHRAFLHALRAQGGEIELFIGWFFEDQSGDTLSHQCMALAGDLQIDLSFDVYPPTQPQQEVEIAADILLPVVEDGKWQLGQNEHES